MPLSVCKTSWGYNLGQCAVWINDDTICDRPNKHEGYHIGHNPYGGPGLITMDDDGNIITEGESMTRVDVGQIQVTKAEAVYQDSVLSEAIGSLSTRLSGLEGWISDTESRLSHLMGNYEGPSDTRALEIAPSSRSHTVSAIQSIEDRVADLIDRLRIMHLNLEA